MEAYILQFKDYPLLFKGVRLFFLKSLKRLGLSNLYKVKISTLVDFLPYFIR